MKHPEIEKFLDNFATKEFGISRKDNLCVFCGSSEVEFDDFRDNLSRKEWEISHLCQNCQDETFGV